MIEALLKRWGERQNFVSVDEHGVGSFNVTCKIWKRLAQTNRLRNWKNRVFRNHPNRKIIWDHNLGQISFNNKKNVDLGHLRFSVSEITLRYQKSVNKGKSESQISFRSLIELSDVFRAQNHNNFVINVISYSFWNRFTQRRDKPTYEDKIVLYAFTSSTIQKKPVKVISLFEKNGKSWLFEF